MNDQRSRSQGRSTRTSRLSNYSGKHFDFLDTHHSVFSKNSYYHDMKSIHPWNRRPCSPYSGISLATLRTKSCSSRVTDLAKPKIKREKLLKQEFYDNINNYGYTGVKSTALTAQCSDRIIALAKPKKRPNIDADILPKIVSKSAHRSDLAKPRHNIVLISGAWKNKQKS